MVATPRWGGLRVEPYDPDAVDGDNDGIVQEGTAWERPVGTRVLDRLGKEIARGATSLDHIPGISYQDSRGLNVAYSPHKVTGGVPTSPLGRIGAPSLRELGIPSAHQYNLTTLVPTPAAVPDLPELDVALRDLQVEEQALLNAVRDVDQRVVARHGPIDTSEQAVDALTTAFPGLDRATLEAQLPGGQLSSRDRGHVVGLLSAAMDDPTTAATVRITLNATDLGGNPTATSWGLTDGPGLPQIVSELHLNPLAGRPSGSENAHAAIVTQLLDDGIVTAEEAAQLDGIHAANHAFAHANLIQHAFGHAGHPIDGEQDLAWWAEFGPHFGIDVESITSSRKFRKPGAAEHEVARLARDPKTLQRIGMFVQPHMSDDLTDEQQSAIHGLAFRLRMGSSASVGPQEEMALVRSLEASGIDLMQARSFDGELNASSIEQFRYENDYRKPVAALQSWLDGPPDSGEPIVSPASTLTPEDARELRQAMERWTIDPSGYRKDADAWFERIAASDLTTPGTPPFLVAQIQQHGQRRRVLYRGVDPGEEGAREIDHLRVGETVDLPLVGTTQARDVAAGRFNGGRPGGTLVIFEGATALSVNEHHSTHQYAFEDEYITSGRFEVVSIIEQPAEQPFLAQRILDAQDTMAVGGREDWGGEVTPDMPMRVVTLRAVADIDPTKPPPAKPVDPSLAAEPASQEVLDHAVSTWAFDSGAKYHGFIDALRSGERSMPPGTRDAEHAEAAALMDAVAAAPPSTRPLYRGENHGTLRSEEDIVARFTFGSIVDADLRGFSSDRKIAERFAETGDGGMPVVFELAPGARAAKLSDLSEVHYGKDEQEHLVMGGMRVESVRFEGRGRRRRAIVSITETEPLAPHPSGTYQTVANPPEVPLQQRRVEAKFSITSFEDVADWEQIPPDVLAEFKQQLQHDRDTGHGPNSGRYGINQPEDKALVTLARAQGFDAQAPPVSQEEADAIVEAGGLVIWRGLSNPEHAEALRHGEYFGGRGISGGGHYFAEAPMMGGEYASPTAGDYTATLTKMILRPDAKIANIDDIKGLMQAIDNDPNKELLTYDYGHFAMAQGYDAIEVPETEETSRIIVVLNRGACVLPPQPANDELRALVSDPNAGRPKAVEQGQALERLRERVNSSDMTITEKAEAWASALQERRAAGLFVRSFEYWGDMVLVGEQQTAFQELQDSPSFLAMSPQEQLTYLDDLVNSRHDRGLYFAQFSALAAQIRARIGSPAPDGDDDVPPAIFV